VTEGDAALDGVVQGNARMLRSNASAGVRRGSTTYFPPARRRSGAAFGFGLRNRGAFFDRPV